MLPAFFANGGEGLTRLRLLMAAMGAAQQDPVLFLCRHSMFVLRGDGGSTGCPGRFGHLGRFTWTRGWRRRCNLVRIDFRLPDVRDAFFDDQFAGANVAEQLGLGLDLDFFLGVYVAV